MPDPMMPEPETRGRIMRSVPLALLFTLLVQAATVVWWASAHERDDQFTKIRLTQLESGLSRAQDAETMTLERLARIEERVNAQSATLDRIEKKLERTR